MQKCNGKFCSNPAIKTVEDARKCIEAILANHPGWNRVCFYHRVGEGCEECGGRVVRSGGCYICISCGYSPCG